MLLDLSEIVIREGMHVGLDIDQPGVEDPDLQFVEPLKGHLDFHNAVETVSINGEVDAVLHVACARCLADARIEVPVVIDEHFPIDDIMHPKREPKVDEEYDSTIATTVYLDQGRPILDLDELLRQLILAELPMTAVCSEECQGLCPHCGVNRNETQCKCDEEEANRPLAVLATLLKDDGS